LKLDANRSVPGRPRLENSFPEKGGTIGVERIDPAGITGGKNPFRIYQLLSAHYQFDRGWPEGEWPVTGRFDPPLLEVVAGALLVQNTRWENVESSLDTMVARGMVSAGAILGTPVWEVEEAVRSCGFFHRKASSLIDVCRRWASTFGLPPGDIRRKDLLDVPGIGPETADTLLLYVLDRPEFIADAYTRRLVPRVGFEGAGRDYRSVKTFFESSLPGETCLFKRYHALIIQHARRHCRNVPSCSGCPLQVQGICAYSANV